MFIALSVAGLLQSPSDAAASDAAAAAAQAAVSNPEAPFSCVRDGGMPEIKMCAADDMEAETERMQQYLGAARIRANASDEDSAEYGPRTRQAAWLSESQQAWEVYAERRCEGVLEATSGGTMGALGWMGCMIEATRQRTHDIWSDYLTYWDTTPPVLPEPIQSVGEERATAD